MQVANGFSKLSKVEKLEYISKNYLGGTNFQNIEQEFKSYWHSDRKVQELIDKFSENTISNFYLPYGVIPNILMNGKNYCVPMVIEESSVVAAASRSAKFWSSRGGFKSRVISSEKIGQVHFSWQGDKNKLFSFFERVQNKLVLSVAHIIKNMELRGGGITSIKILDKTDLEPNYFQIYCTFETCDAMGANFINSVLEGLAHSFKESIFSEESFSGSEREVEIIMSILSNYTPNCLVESYVECPIDQLDDPKLGLDPNKFAQKFYKAVRVAQVDVHRATTHNKGIFNGLDAVILATGNDFRATEACAHTYAARDGQYRSLTNLSLEDGIFKYSLKIPIAIGTVGGLTSLHPMAKKSLDLLGRPTSAELMQVIATVGLAQNFAAIRSLVTSGIQKGHMKMHLMNILNQFEATSLESANVCANFKDKVITYTDIREYLAQLRGF